MIVKTPSFSQTSKFEELKNEMFFNILIFKPDSSVIDFVRKYYPMFCLPFQHGNWSVYPKAPPIFIQTIHSLIFKHHPFFDTKFRAGRLDFLSSETKGEGRGVQDFQLWFMFDSKKDAINAFNKLSTMFDKVSKTKKITKRKDKIIASYSDKDIPLRSNSIQFILTKDELYESKYKIFFRIGSFTYPAKLNNLKNSDQL